MFGCMVGLIIGIIGAIVGLIRLTMTLMATSVSSLFIGVDEATDRIADSWIDQAAGHGANIGYSPVMRGGAKVGAWILLIIGWLLTVGAIVWVIQMLSNS